MLKDIRITPRSPDDKDVINYKKYVAGFRRPRTKAIKGKSAHV